MYQAKEKKKCNSPDCKTLTASKVGFCGKHFYMSKLVNKPGQSPKEKSRASAFRRPRRRTAAKVQLHGDYTGTSGDATITLTEPQVDVLLLRLPMATKVKLWISTLLGN